MACRCSPTLRSCPVSISQHSVVPALSPHAVSTGDMPAGVPPQAVTGALEGPLQESCVPGSLQQRGGDAGHVGGEVEGRVYRKEAGKPEPGDRERARGLQRGQGLAAQAGSSEAPMSSGDPRRALCRKARMPHFWGLMDPSGCRVGNRL